MILTLASDPENLVDIDVQGNNLFQSLSAAVAERRRKAYRSLGIDESFDYTSV